VSGLALLLVGLPLLLGAMGILVGMVQLGIAIVRDDMERGLAALVFMLTPCGPLLLLSIACSLVVMP
jgi:hypothetical protein